LPPAHTPQVKPIFEHRLHALQVWQAIQGFAPMQVLAWAAPKLAAKQTSAANANFPTGITPV